VDRDGTIIREPRDKQIDSLDKLEFVPGIIGGLRLLKQSGLDLVMVSNQDGLGSRKYPRHAFATVQTKILSTLAGEGITFERIYICPHRPGDRCSCRKPGTGMVEKWIMKNPLRKEASFVLGDRMSDVEFAANLGLRAAWLVHGKRAKRTRRLSNVLLQTSDAIEACQAIVRASRCARVRRTTGETSVDCEVSLTNLGHSDINTGIRFLDHMLMQIARHSGFDIKIRARGDLDVDDHHLIEDIAIALGQAVRQALAKKAGIERYGFVLPMDEARATVAIDLSGRAALSFDVEFKRERVGDLATEMIEHFFRSFAESLGASLHISCRGRNEHHKIEAIFKAVARALDKATKLDLDRLRIPSSKGVL
jgi:imidazoleglycerol-phosphate dehydratase/histidinol-phosphatase